MRCHDCKEEVESSVCIGIANESTTLALLHYCPRCFVANAGADYIELMWGEAERFVEDEDEREKIIEKLGKLKL